MISKTEIEVVAAPADYAEGGYQFFKNNETGHMWKAKIEILSAFSPMIGGDVEAAPTQLAISVTVSIVNAEGKTLLEDGKPIILPPHLHTFTEVEMNEPDFDPTIRLMKVIAERVHIGEGRLQAVKKINALGEVFKSKQTLKADKFTFTEPKNPDAPPDPNDPSVAKIQTGESVTAPPPLGVASSE